MTASAIVGFRTRRWMAAIVGLLLALGCGLPAAAETDSAKPVVVKAAVPEFAITLGSNRTTGYGWYLESLDADLIEAVGQVYVTPSTGALGAPGHETWTFKARAGAFAVPRVTTLIFRSLRPWDARDGGEARFTVVLVPGG